MKILTFSRISSQDQEKLALQQSHKQDVEVENENGCTYLVCHKCDGFWVVDTLSRWIRYPKGELRERKRYPKPRCPFCDKVGV
ncbi:hypothetical protein HYW42_00920 [Candidatus Daviesbacteria bacterium]|nr:hypothetical protein [Candidatus Daviesbacteria bacterium]